jgi:metallo-beta-lactamase family protein
MKITFLGAAGGVTGSKHLIETNNKKILLDCGLFQGHHEEAAKANATLPAQTKNLDLVILSHAHADHCGLLPLLVKNGFAKKIYATSATIDIAHLIMLDTANLQENNYKYLTKFANHNDKILPPIYSENDVALTDRLFSRVLYFKDTQKWQPIDDNIKFKFYNAGHILGSAVTVIQADEPTGSKILAYTGDLGNTNVPILPDPENITDKVDFLISECTYGDKNHRPLEEAVNHLKEIILEAIKNKCRIIVPAFALGRTQELIYIIHKLYDNGDIPAFPIYVDSPLSNSITEVFTKHSQDFDQQTWKDFINNHESPFSFKNLNYTRTVEESKSLNKMPGPMMIIASSGMLEGGRILHHLENNISDPKAIILLTGYQAEGTLGSRLFSGEKKVSIYGHWYPVEARIVNFNEFSAHADQTGLLNYITSLKDLKKLFLVHSESRQAEIFSQLVHSKLPNLEIIIPKLGDSFEI